MSSDKLSVEEGEFKLFSIQPEEPIHFSLAGHASQTGEKHTELSYNEQLAAKNGIYDRNDWRRFKKELEFKVICKFELQLYMSAFIRDQVWIFDDRNWSNFYDFMMSSEAGEEQTDTSPTLPPDPKFKARFDALTTEFQYYGAAIRNLAPALTTMRDRNRLLPWVNKLFAAEYHVGVLRDKRNRYLAAITVNMINDELTGIFEEEPPSGTTRGLSTMSVTNAPCAEWELDSTWSEYVAALPDNYEEIPCSFHNPGESCEKDNNEMDQQLDNEFWFLMYQIRPYAAMMPCPDARTIVAAWIQTLCRLGCKKCGRMKGLRNDYAYALYGCVHDLRISGPFQDYPPWKRLQSLPEAARFAAKRHPLTSPYSEEADAFMYAQPTPEEGAFCYIAITGDFADPNTLLPT